MLLRSVVAGVLGLAPVVTIAQAPATVQKDVQLYRLTFVMRHGESTTNDQSFTMDVPVNPGSKGAAHASFATASMDDPQSLVQQDFRCSNVHPSGAGLSLDIEMQSDRESAAIPGVITARHQHGEFQRQVNLELGKLTEVTLPMKLKPLGKTDPALAARIAGPAPHILVSAVAVR